MRLGAAIFTYGTLMSGEDNHGFALSPDCIEPARAQGKLYHIGFCPALVARGVGEASPYRLRDALRSGVRACPPEAPVVEGELFWYADDERAERALRMTDQLEGFDPFGERTYGYKRILIPVKLSDGAGVLAWAYTRRGDEVLPEEYLTHGSWRRGKVERGVRKPEYIYVTP